jgi:NADPH:quinone reductase-like Zn-dependent oxidoreductase
MLAILQRDQVMRSYQLTTYGKDGLVITDLPAPHPAPNEVVVRMEAASLNYRDWLMLTRNFYSEKVALPIVPIADGAGVVVETGSAVTRFRPGDRVTTFYKSRWLAGAIRPEWEGHDFGGPCPGVMCELACFDEYSLARAPSHLTGLQAATLPIAALTAWQVLEQAHITTGQTVLTLGTGGVSIFALQLAKARGAKVVVISSSDEKLARAKALGADFGINYKATPQWGAAVREATGGKGVDAVVENAGAGTFAQSLEAVGMHGFIGVVGFLSGTDSQVPLEQIIQKRVHVQGIAVASLEQHERMVDALEAIRLEPVLDKVYGFNQLPEALDHMLAATHFGKLAIDFAQ